MFKSRLAAALIAALVLSSTADAQVESQAGGALVGGALVAAASAFGGAIVGSALWPGSATGDYYDLSGLAGALVGATAGAALGYPCGCAVGTATVGAWQERDGNTGLAYAGAYLGLPVGIGLVWLGVLAHGSALEVPLYAAGALAPPAGAVIGYNLRPPRTDPQDAFVTRLTSPRLVLSLRSGPDRQTYFAFDCRTVTMRF